MSHSLVGPVTLLSKSFDKPKRELSLDFEVTADPMKGRYNIKLESKAGLITARCPVISTDFPAVAVLGYEPLIDALKELRKVVNP